MGTVKCPGCELSISAADFASHALEVHIGRVDELWGCGDCPFSGPTLLSVLHHCLASTHRPDRVSASHPKRLLNFVALAMTRQRNAQPVQAAMPRSQYRKRHTPRFPKEPLLESVDLSSHQDDGESSSLVPTPEQPVTPPPDYLVKLQQDSLRQAVQAKAKKTLAPFALLVPASPGSLKRNCETSNSQEQPQGRSVEAVLAEFPDVGSYEANADGGLEYGEGDNEGDELVSDWGEAEEALNDESRPVGPAHSKNSIRDARRVAPKKTKCHRCFSKLKSLRQNLICHAIGCIKLKPFQCTNCGLLGGRRQYMQRHCVREEECRLAGAEVVFHNQEEDTETLLRGLKECFPGLNIPWNGFK